jgi:hypothetical protein
LKIFTSESLDGRRRREREGRARIVLFLSDTGGCASVIDVQRVGYIRVPDGDAVLLHHAGR